MLNKVILMGRLTADPELRQTPSNVATCRFTVAITRSFAAKGEERQSDFVTVVAWRQTAEFVAKYFTKGKMIIVEGALRNNNYTDKNDVKHYGMDVHAENVSFGESKGAGNEGGSYAPNTNTNFQPPRQENQHAQDDNNSASLAIGNLSEFEEILGDGQLPF